MRTSLRAAAAIQGLCISAACSCSNALLLLSSNPNDSTTREFRFGDRSFLRLLQQ
jgi:hypothetical protein